MKVDREGEKKKRRKRKSGSKVCPKSKGKRKGRAGRICELKRRTKTRLVREA